MKGPPEGWTCRPARQEERGLWATHAFAGEAWLEAACRLSGGSPVLLTVLKGDEPVACAALHERRGPVGAEILAPPFGVFHAPCWRSGPPSDILLGSQALAAWLEAHYGSASLVFPPAVTDLRGFLWRGWKPQVLYTYQAPLGDPESNRRACADDVRQSVRKAEKAGLEVLPGGDPGAAVDLWLSTARRQGVTAAGSREGLVRLFEDLRRAGLLSIWEARLAGEPLAAVWILDGPGWSGYWLAANSEQGLKTGANALLVWRLFEILAPRGGTLDLCGAGFPTIAHFKGKFGVTLVPYFGVSRALSARARLRGMLSR